MAIVKVSAQVPVTDPRYGGPILINPGGPGLSGTHAAVYGIRHLQSKYDAAYAYNSDTYVSSDPRARYFDIIGFDPRGVAPSTPSHFCDGESVDETQSVQLPALHALDSVLDAFWNASISASKDCVWDPETNPDGSKIARFASTAMVARDMIEFVERHGEWREKQAEGNDAQTLNRLRWNRGEEPILYVGFSYGAVLGATLAAMQPHRVNRFVLDGVPSAEHYFNGNITSDLLGSDEVVDDFFGYCARAGPEACPLWNGNSANDTRRLVSQAVEMSFTTKPRFVSDIRRGCYLGAICILYSLNADPLSSWRMVAEDLLLSIQPGTAMPAASNQSIVRDTRAKMNVGLDRYNPDHRSAYDDSGLRPMIAGGDSSFRPTLEQYATEIWNPIHRVTEWHGDVAAINWLGVSTWPFQFGWRFGDSHPIASNVTASPILFMSMLRDGVTSLASAREVSSRFRNAELLVVEGHGHTTEAEPSLCAARAVRRYFQTGELPHMKGHCLPVWNPFNEGLDENLSELTMEDASLLPERYRGAVVLAGYGGI